MPRLRCIITSVVVLSLLTVPPVPISAAESPGFRLRLHSGSSLASHRLSASGDTLDADSESSLAKPTGRGLSPRHSPLGTRHSTPRVAFRLPWEDPFFAPSYSRWSRRIGCAASYDLTPRWRIGLSVARVYRPWEYGMPPSGYNPWSTRVTLHVSYGGVRFGAGISIRVYETAHRRPLPDASAHHPGFHERARNRRFLSRASAGRTTPASSRMASYSARHGARRASSRTCEASPNRLDSAPPPRSPKKVASRYASSSNRGPAHSHSRKFRNPANAKSGKHKRGR